MVGGLVIVIVGHLLNQCFKQRCTDDVVGVFFLLLLMTSSSAWSIVGHSCFPDVVLMLFFVSSSCCCSIDALANGVVFDTPVVPVSCGGIGPLLMIDALNDGVVVWCCLLLCLLVVIMTSSLSSEWVFKA